MVEHLLGIAVFVCSHTSPNILFKFLLPKSPTKSFILWFQMQLKNEYLNVAKLSTEGKKQKKSWSLMWTVLTADHLLFYKDKQETGLVWKTQFFGNNRTDHLVHCPEMRPQVLTQSFSLFRHRVVSPTQSSCVGQLLSGQTRNPGGKMSSR